MKELSKHPSVEKQFTLKTVPLPNSIDGELSKYIQQACQEGKFDVFFKFSNVFFVEPFSEATSLPVGLFIVGHQMATRFYGLTKHLANGDHSKESIPVYEALGPLGGLLYSSKPFVPVLSIKQPRNQNLTPRSV